MSFFGSRCFYVGASDLVRYGKRLVGQSFSALCASSLEYISAISSLHSLSEAVLLLSLAFFRLISSEHRLHLLQIKSEAFRFFSNKIRFYTMTGYIIPDFLLFVKSFSDFF